MPDANEPEYEHVEVNVSHKIEVKFQPEDFIEAAKNPVGTIKDAASQAADKAGRLKGLAQQVKSYFTGGSKPPHDPA